jgi:hypothetical protein
MSLFDVRDTIDKIIKAADGKDIKTKALIEALRREHADVIAAASVELENMALTKVVNDVAARRSGSALPGQAELFSGYSGIRQTIMLKSAGMDGKVTFTRKAIEEATAAELETWLADHTQARANPPGKFAGMRKLLDDAKQLGGAEGATIGALMRERKRRDLSEG